MKKFLIAIVVLFGVLIVNSIEAQELTALEIITKADNKNRGETSEGVMTMTIVRPGWSRSVSMKAWSKGDDYFLLYITAPAKEKGQVFLKREKEMWNWVPTIERMIKIPPSMMMQSWMGSDFTNDDLVKQSSLIVDYNHKLLGKEILRDKECYKIELIPKPDAAVVWGKIITYVTVDGFDFWTSKYYDEDNYLVNTDNAYNLKKMGDRIIPTKIEMIPADKKGQKTILEINSMTFNKPISDEFFSQQNMKRVR
ncbi:MAG: outer membrane lipoprotein-sorting protein [Saprospiraceae bacterium]|nr:outer membrane lipoprotein-sorting protein [Saprospiraceae bacterium]